MSESSWKTSQSVPILRENPRRLVDFPRDKQPPPPPPPVVPKCPPSSSPFESCVPVPYARAPESDICLNNFKILHWSI
ncbi:hypothetical protein PUN28_015805 [Cardiocondyla obscurior]|uniref:Uncharacterized protein n=1 Tax=Cardiocondyla obscurior TaxID=286306 RepID=A0AAW2EQI2_9HYME